MGRKIFVSYKYGDTQVQDLNLDNYTTTTARHYVDVLQEALDENDHINKGEKSDGDLSQFQDETIWGSLKDKIFDSSITIVLISKGMREQYTDEYDQWMPWEISYSLRQLSRNGVSSRPNGMLAVVLPDNQGSYSHFIEEGTCSKCNCRMLRTDSIFKILSNNMFNIKKPVYSECNNHSENSVYVGDSSYITSVKWVDFLNDLNGYIDKAIEIRDNIEVYNITRTIK